MVYLRGEQAYGNPFGANIAGIMTRRDEVVKLRKIGLSYAQIGHRLGISRERVRQILKGNPARQKPTVDSKVMLRTGEVARVMGISISTVRRWDEKGILKSCRIGPRCDRRFRREEIYGLLREAEIE